MTTPQTAPAPHTPERQAAIDSEIVLLNWVIVEAQLAHESAKAHAAKRDKPMPITALRLVIQAHNRKIALMGLAPAPRNAKRATALQLAEDLAHTRERLQGETCPVLPNTPVAPETPEVAPEIAPAAPYLNRAQRRALLRTKGKRKAA